ncbi:xylulokinase [Actinopolymorpha rutila]|uniref:Xylulose kinase n=1 Tax=Actinopolymorpha rutila TaxID=446787 RepID=A0A852ZN93_9ACTN|nr:xylulokinase [Actinopolymorpha rutila]NYH90939.1 xylulokinase [Actinopolymorpha rutila]
MPKVAGVDSSTQSCKIVVADADTGEVLDERVAAHPEGTECPPEAWWSALREAAEGLLDDVAAIGVAGQQHGMVTLDEAGEVVRPALLWNDTRSAAAALRLVQLLGPAGWAEAVGSVPLASMTVSKLAWLAEHEPGNAERVARVLLPHDYLTWELCGRPDQPVTDRGDASGTAYWSPVTGDYRTDLLQLALGRTPELPKVLGPAEPAGETGSAGPNGVLRPGTLVSAGTGDNMGAALGLGIEPGDVVVSLGTSGTVFAVHDKPSTDASGIVAGFADATGRFLPLVCTLNAARVLTATANMLGVDLAGLERLAREAGPGAGGLVLLPYLDGERTPNLPDAAGSLHNLRRDTMTPANLARAAVEGMLCGLADGLDAVRAQGVNVRRVLLIGGAARSEAVRSAAPTVFGVPVTVPPPAEYVALGAARQAAWALAGSAAPPSWSLGESVVRDDVDEAAGERIRSAYAQARTTLHPHG